MGRRKKTVKWVWRKNQSTASSSAPPPPPWVDLPRDITADILRRIGAVEILESAQKVCSTWWHVCHDPAMWRKISFCQDTCFPPKSDLEIMCWHAVDRSHGELLDISIYGFGSDLLLEHIANSSSQLRSLSLGYCHGMTSKGFVEAVRRLPLLEKIHFSFIAPGSEFIEQLGVSCPNLKSFAMNQERSLFRQSDSDALAIAKSMPGLLHLSLIGNQMSDQGLEAILDGCTHLESLDLRQCFGVKLTGSLGKRCLQLKSLKTPNELAGEYDYDELEVDDESDGFTDWLDCGIQFAGEYDSDELDEETDGLTSDSQVTSDNDQFSSDQFSSDDADDQFSSDDADDEVADISSISTLPSEEDCVSETRRNLEIAEMQDLLIKGSAREAQAAARAKAIHEGDQPSKILGSRGA